MLTKSLLLETFVLTALIATGCGRAASTEGAAPGPAGQPDQPKGTTDLYNPPGLATVAPPSPASCTERMTVGGEPMYETIHAFNTAGLREGAVFTILDERYKMMRAYEQIEDHEASWVYDSEGRSVAETYSGKSGERTVARSFDSAGRLTRVERDGGYQGGVTTWQWSDVSGDRLALRRQTYEGTGSAAEQRWAYDARGEPLEERRTFNGKTTQLTSWEYDAQGALARMVIVRGVRVSETRYFEDAKLGAWTEHREDFYGRGWERLTVANLDGDGRPLRVRVDQPLDGIWDTEQELAYDGAGRKILERSTTLVGKYAGQTSEERWTFDAAGRELEKISDSSKWGGSRQVSTYDGDRLTLKQTFSLEDSSLRRQIRRIYDPQTNKLLRVEEDAKGEGNFVVTERRTYDAHGQLTTLERPGTIYGRPQATRYTAGCYELLQDNLERSRALAEQEWK